MKPTEILGVGAVVAIILGFVMTAVGPNSWIVRKWNETPGYSQSSQQTQAPATGRSVVGGPSLSAEKIDQILANAGSPAGGTGHTFYQDSITYNIDAAYALAFFHHESSFGTAGAATETHNIGNIVCTAGYSCIGRFRSYSSWSEGIDDWYKLIKDQYVGKWGCTTVESIIPHYAPNSDGNSESSYIAAVQADVQAWRAAA